MMMQIIEENWHNINSRHNFLLQLKKENCYSIICIITAWTQANKLVQYHSLKFVCCFLYERYHTHYSTIIVSLAIHYPLVVRPYLKSITIWSFNGRFLYFKITKNVNVILLKYFCLWIEMLLWNNGGFKFEVEPLY